MKRSKTLSSIKKQQYRGLRSDLASELGVKAYTVDNALRGRTKDAVFLAKLRRVATSLIENRKKEIKSLSKIK